MMRMDAGTDTRAARPAPAMDGVAGRNSAGAVPATVPGSGLRITPSRQIVDRRDPSLSFKVSAEGFTAFDILLTTDPALFDAANAERRTPANFRSSRQDFDGESIPAAMGFYMTPTAFLGAIANATPMPDRLYYVAVGYRNADRSAGVFSVPAETLATSAPAVQLAANLGSATLSTVLGAAVERLGQVGANRRITRARPLSAVGMPRQTVGGLPVNGARNGAGPSNGAPRPLRAAVASPDGRMPDPGTRPGTDGPLPAPDAGKSPAATLRPPAANGGVAANNGNAPASAVQPHPAQAGTNGPRTNGGYFDEDAVYGAAPESPNGNGYRDLDAAPAAPGRLQPADDYDDGYGPMPIPDAAEPQSTAPSGEPAPGSHGDVHGNGMGTFQPDGNGPAIPDLDPGPGQAPATPGNMPAHAVAHAVGGRRPRPAEGLHRSLTGGVLDTAAKMAVVETIAQFEGAGRYDAMNLDGEYRGRFGQDNTYYNRAHVGLSYGLVQFTQDGGALGDLLVLMQGKDPDLFAEIFGPSAEQLIAVTTAAGPRSLEVEGGRSVRVQPVDGADLWEEPWITRFRTAAQHEPFREAQRELAISRYLDPILPYARWLGLWTQRGLAMLYDRSVQQGSEGGMRFVVNAVGPVDTAAKRTQALEALGHATLEDFQRAAGITADGDWGKQSHAAMIGALRGLGAQSPIQLPDYDESLDQIVAAAATRFFAHRVSNLRTSGDLSDAPLTE